MPVVRDGDPVSARGCLCAETRWKILCTRFVDAHTAPRASTDPLFDIIDCLRYLITISSRDSNTDNLSGR
jgi:hypothetical protein